MPRTRPPYPPEFRREAVSNPNPGVSPRRQLHDLPDEMVTKLTVLYYSNARDALLETPQSVDTVSYAPGRIEWIGRYHSRTSVHSRDGWGVDGIRYPRPEGMR